MGRVKRTSAQRDNDYKELASPLIYRGHLRGTGGVKRPSMLTEDDLMFTIDVNDPVKLINFIKKINTTFCDSVIRRQFTNESEIKTTLKRSLHKLFTSANSNVIYTVLSELYPNEITVDDIILALFYTVNQNYYYPKNQINDNLLDILFNLNLPIPVLVPEAYFFQQSLILTPYHFPSHPHNIKLLETYLQFLAALHVLFKWKISFGTEQGQYQQSKTRFKFYVNALTKMMDEMYLNEYNQHVAIQSEMKSENGYYDPNLIGIVNQYLDYESEPVTYSDQISDFEKSAIESKIALCNSIMFEEK